MTTEKAGPTLLEEILDATAAGYDVTFAEIRGLLTRRTVMVIVQGPAGGSLRNVVVDANESAAVDLFALAVDQARDDAAAQAEIGL